MSETMEAPAIKRCRDCIYFRDGGGALVCTNDAARQTNAIGDSWPALANGVRSSPRLCGPDAVWFVAIPPATSAEPYDYKGIAIFIGLIGMFILIAIMAMGNPR